MPKIAIKNRDKLIICGLFLAKFDTLAYKSLGFSSFMEAFNVLGFALQGKPSNIKNYRDEFDPYFDNARKGWQRDLRAYTKIIFEKYQNMEFEAFKNLISSFLIENYEEKLQVNEFLDSKIETSFIKRVATGKAAENYFLQNFKKHFEDFNVLDVREYGCGFDFKLTLKNQQICVEVKGLNENKGQFLLTQKEFEMADKLKENYCLFIVRNLKEKPKESLFFHPLNHFKLKEQNIKIVQKSYQGVL
ncbi:DUF3883 domain-containing protein [Campylobacter upsaliensis]|nr:DUF3883 domain-containing protein [Campylobacter upsaliensis]EAJ0879845.1 DUF3883 domain-containing protein [Campylobacter upsaliensis]ECW8268151.1 DUF3883 domain-containing protein [Campylobacter upsaliensis]EFM2942619.1 DUF3883 domain-containing protein [Campylobacter upsaliensis]EJP4819215.1 DUF3883 domain-containing protein [Campylobacter upsaliensis]